MASNWYSSGVAKMSGMSPAIAFLSDTIQVALAPSGYTPDVDHDFLADITEIGAVTNYTPGAGSSSHPTLASKTITVDDGANKVVFDAADPAFGALGSGATIEWMVIYKFITNAAASPLIACLDVPTTPTNGASITGQLNAADGIGKFQL
jgi:hypothetical protein